MSTVRSGVLTAWAGAWLAGRISLDQVVDATTGDDAPHVVTGLPGFEEVVALRDVLVAWRRRGVPPRLVLPVPGDVRGLPGPAALRAAALEAGEAVVADGLAVVPTVTHHAPSSAPPSVEWTAFVADPVPADQIDIRQAQYDLTTAIRASATALLSAGVSGSNADVPALLSGARRAGEFVNLPPDHPAAAVALLSQAERLQAVLDLATGDPLGGAVDQYGMAARTEALRPLATAVRRARLAACNADPSAARRD
ncbi:hypothetical protein [uncultured Jatrophihabitans sp.]|uniref:hypothetical protein n=1 Tax=uncultured Jatrophihabitans sp. TaxID=1610747 RepID=UPI0035CC24C4